MTGPSLYGLWDRRAGSLSSFPRYSPAMKAFGKAWTETTLDELLTDPKVFLPGNSMTFAGIPDQKARVDIIAFLQMATQPRQNTQNTPAVEEEQRVPSLKSVPARLQVKEIKYCGDTYTVTTADGQTAQFWERNLRFKTDRSEDGPPSGAPAILEGGMVGDRASVIFAAPEEFGQFIKRGC